MATTVRLKLPRKWKGEPSWIMKRYPDRTLDFDTAERAASSELHRELFVAVGEAKQRFRCTCRDDRQLEIMVRLRQPPYLALMPHTSLEHDGACAFYHAPITSHVSDAIEQTEDGTLRVRLNFRLGEPATAEEKIEKLNEAPLRARQVNRQLNRFGLDGLLRLLFTEAGLHRWRPWYRTQDRVISTMKEDSWQPACTRLLQTLDRIDAQGQRGGALKTYTRIGKPGTVAAFEEGTILAVVDVINGIEPPRMGHHWKCYLAGWGKNHLVIRPDQVEALLRQLRFHPARIKSMMTERHNIWPRDPEVWWGCLLVRVEEDDKGKKWYRVLDHAALRTDLRCIPVESLDEIEMTQHLVEDRRGFCKPLFPGELAALPKRRPDFILEDTLTPCCIEVAGMSDVYDYNDRDDERLKDYEKADVLYKRWKRGDPLPVLDGSFRQINKTSKYILTPPPGAKPIILRKPLVLNRVYIIR